MAARQDKIGHGLRPSPLLSAPPSWVTWQDIATSVPPSHPRWVIGLRPPSRGQHEGSCPPPPSSLPPGVTKAAVTRPAPRPPLSADRCPRNVAPHSPCLWVGLSSRPSFLLSTGKLPCIALCLLAMVVSTLTFQVGHLDSSIVYQVNSHFAQSCQQTTANTFT
ncbi:hypothetical protein L7F22_051811 [Adiantum nelumboides]|nr:hypothetical protein [Adiantum nelumboides]